MTYSTCCRSNDITSGSAGQDFFLSALLDNTLNSCNDSPVFSSSNVIFHCDNSPVNYAQGASDSDGDELRYSLTSCKQGAGQSVTYNQGLNGNQPLSTSSGFAIDPQSGAISFTPSPDVEIAQIAPICVLVEQYIEGVKIGETVREILFVSDQVAAKPLPVLGPWGIILMALLLLGAGLVLMLMLMHSFQTKA